MTAVLQPAVVGSPGEPVAAGPADREATRREIDLVGRHTARNYAPLPVVASSAEGAWITDVDGRRYLDCLAAYSAVNFGHRNPEITATAHAQLDTVTPGGPRWRTPSSTGSP